MDTCTESASSVWLTFGRALGLVRIDTTRDTRLMMEHKVRGNVETFKQREAELERQMERESALARAAMAAQDKTLARRHVRQAQATRGARFDMPLSCVAPTPLFYLLGCTQRTCTRCAGSCSRCSSRPR